MSDYLGMKIKKHWQVARPKMVALLTSLGVLEEVVDWASEKAKEEMGWLMRRGPPWWSAEEVALAKFLFPSEEEQDTLTQDQMPFLPSE